MNVNISNFMEERRANTEEIPYMEMKTSFGNKENIKPASRTLPSQPKHTKEESFGLSLPLGQEYELKKQKLKQELRLDYRRFMSEKKNQIITDQPPQSHMLSLPIKERKSAKEKLQDERNKEYNLFLRGQEGAQKIGKASPSPQALERDCFGSSSPKYPAGSPEGQTQRASQSPENIVFSRRDAATLTEPISGVPKVSRPRRHWVEMPDRWGGPNQDHTSSEEEMELLEKEKLRKEDLGATRRGGKHDNGSHSLRAPTSVQSRSVNEQNMSEFATGLMIGAAEGDEAPQRRKERYRLELLQQIAEQQKNKRKEKELELRVAATGAVDPEKKPDRIKQFGTTTREYESRRRDVPYQTGLGREEFRADSAMRLKEEKPPQAPKENVPPERPRVAFQSPSLDHNTVLSRLANTSGLGLEAGAGFGANGTTPIAEDNHRSLSRTLGEIVAPRIAGVRPPLGPSLTDSYQTPYDNAYYYYGARNPLDPNLAYYGPAVGQQSRIPPEAHWPVLQPPSGDLTHHGGVVSSGPAFIASERLQQSKESAVSYQEALKQQIQERQQRRHREKVEKELYDAKIEAERKAYEPWGRAGGGAPLRDDDGNLISDLKQMHKTNLEAYDSGGRVARIPVSTRKEPSGVCSSHPPFQARGNLFNDLPTPQQLQDQEKYKDCLKQQIEEKRRKEAEEKERRRLEEEKEERRLAEQRAQIQREYEEEQERKRQKEKEQMAKNEELIRQAEERRKEAEKTRKEADEKENEALRKKHEREKQTHLDEKVQRAPSPPLPALQKKLRQQTPRPPSVESHRSSATLSMRSMSAPHSPPVPARRNEIRATEEKRTVIRELSALRRQLRSEQRRLEGQLMQSNRNDPTSPVQNRSREQLQEDVFEEARLRKHVPIRRPASHTTAEVNMQTLQEFNRLKYRDGPSREEVRQAYPDPPNDDHSLDIQQQALLRQQQRTINSLRRGRAADYFDSVSSQQRHHEQRQNSVEDLRRHLLLDSESAFIDPSGDSFLLQSRRDQKVRLAVRKPDMSDDVVNGYTRPDSGPDSQSLLSLTSAEIERLRERTKNKMTQLNNMREHDWRSGEVSAEDGEELWPQTPSTDRRVSIDTTATDPWLRPSSSDTLKRFMSGRRPSSRKHAGQDWEGPSTYHG